MRRVLVVVLALAVAAGAGACNKKKDDDSAVSTPKAASNVECLSDSLMDTYSRIPHTDSPGYSGPLSPRDNPQYTVNPPSGGDHLSVPVGPGVWEGARIPPDGNLVHSLEHGYVIIWHKPGLPDAEEQTILKVLHKYPRDVLVVERANMDKPVAATAWRTRMLCSGADEGALSAFVEDNRNQAPEKIPH
jgi:hypothetical protein